MSASEHDRNPVDARPKVEIGWLLEGDLPPEQREAATAAAAKTEESLAACLPDFNWVIETLERPAEAERGRVEPVRLLDAAEIDRDQRGWDFVIVVTSRELHGRRLSRVHGVTSGIFATAVISTAYLAGPASDGTPIESRLHVLAMHLFGRLNGLVPDCSSTWMRRIETENDLDRMRGFDAPATNDLSARMEDVSDLRVEELQKPPQGRLAFYTRSLWQNRSAMPRAVLRMRPWSFPLRLRRLTTAAGSALAVLVMTAESWEVAANLSPLASVVLSLSAVAATSVYLITVQRLLAIQRGPIREQRAVRNAGTVIAVVIGMSVTYAGVFAASWLFAVSLFGDALLESWTGATGDAATSVRIRLGALTASLSVVIGALGASFEPYGYFRHVTQVDDEI